jgi:NAD(P)-dependent dehydrogenase (short-subunit alcohol dehydrogenase family)
VAQSADLPLPRASLTHDDLGQLLARPRFLVDEVANLVVMLASPLMQMVNGTMIEIDGGQDKPLMDRFRDKNR